jgi:ribonuclease R
VEVEIEKVDALRHQIDLGVVLPEGSEPEEDWQPGPADTQEPDAGDADPDAPPMAGEAEDATFIPVAVLGEV